MCAGYSGIGCEYRSLGMHCTGLGGGGGGGFSPSKEGPPPRGLFNNFGGGKSKLEGGLVKGCHTLLCLLRHEGWVRGE